MCGPVLFLLTCGATLRPLTRDEKRLKQAICDLTSFLPTCEVFLFYKWRRKRLKQAICDHEKTIAEAERHLASLSSSAKAASVIKPLVTLVNLQ
jgi:hypothetical protein